MNNKLLLVLILICVGNNVLAEWKLIQTGKESNEFVDPATIKVSGNLVKMWSLTNISKNIQRIRPGEKAFAIKTIYEYDCINYKSRLLFVAWYNDYMGTGSVERSSDRPKAKWKKITPGIRTNSWKIACVK